MAPWVRTYGVVGLVGLGVVMLFRIWYLDCGALSTSTQQLVSDTGATESQTIDSRAMAGALSMSDAMDARLFGSDGVEARLSEAEAIEATLNDYLYGVKEGDLGRLRRAFHLSAEIIGIRDGVYTAWPAQQYIDELKDWESRPFTPHILAVDYTGSAATGKVQADYGEWKFVDYVQLLKVRGQWKIVSKVNERVVVVDRAR